MPFKYVENHKSQFILFGLSRPQAPLKVTVHLLLSVKKKKKKNIYIGPII